MSHAPAIPLDGNGSVIFGNPARLNQLSARLYDAHNTLLGQDKDLEACKAFIAHNGMAGGCDVALSGPDEDIATLIRDGDPPAFTDTGALDAAITAVRSATFETGALAYGTGHFAGALEHADAHYRDVINTVPEMYGTLFGESGGVIAQNTATTLSYQALDDLENTHAEAYYDVRGMRGWVGNTFGGADNNETMPDGKRFLDTRIGDDVTNFFTAIDQRIASGEVKVGAPADACNIAGMLGVGASMAGAGASGSGNTNVGEDFWERHRDGNGGWGARQAQDLIGAIPRGVAGLGSFGGHVIAGTGDFAWDATFGVGRSIFNGTVTPIIDMAGHTIQETSHWLTGHNGMTTPQYLENLGSHAADNASQVWDSFTGLVDEEWDNAYDLGDTVLGRGYDALYTTLDSTRDALNPFD